MSKTAIRDFHAFGIEAYGAAFDAFGTSERPGIPSVNVGYAFVMASPEIFAVGDEAWPSDMPERAPAAFIAGWNKAAAARTVASSQVGSRRQVGAWGTPGRPEDV